MPLTIVVIGNDIEAPSGKAGAVPYRRSLRQARLQGPIKIGYSLFKSMGPPRCGFTPIYPP